jgi:glycosyltransferase involved in cell wall biosynthesis
VDELLNEFPDARVLTTIVNPSEVPEKLRDAEPSFLQRIPGATSHHEWLVPLMPIAWRTREPIRDVDAVVSSSHACAKAVRVDPRIPHLCYCHTPMRYAWDFNAEAARFPVSVRLPARVAMPLFRRWDRTVSRRVTRFVANSSAVKLRIERYYGRSSSVIHPPVRTDFFTPGGERGDHFLFVGRLVSYKQPELAIRAFEGLPYRLVVVGNGHLEERLRATAPTNVTFLGGLDDAALRELYRSSRALVVPGVEDFGITLAEAQACGTPVIAVAGGGAMDIVDDGATGWLVPTDDIAALRAAIARVAAEPLDAAAIQRRAQRFAAERFRRLLRDELEEMIASSSRTAAAA